MTRFAGNVVLACYVMFFTFGHSAQLNANKILRGNVMTKNEQKPVPFAHVSVNYDPLRSNRIYLNTNENGEFLCGIPREYNEVLINITHYEEAFQRTTIHTEIVSLVNQTYIENHFLIKRQYDILPQNPSPHENKRKEMNIDVTTTENMRLNTPMLMENDILNLGITFNYSLGFLALKGFMAAWWYVITRHNKKNKKRLKKRKPVTRLLNSSHHCCFKITTLNTPYEHIGKKSVHKEFEEVERSDD